jgi:light-regulated signal transduction histidine kinase (bacteriophytochrome)
LKSLNEELSTAIQELTVANRELADFARVAAHDLKAPLRAIGSLAGIVSAQYGDKVGEQGRDMLETLVGRASRMYTHIDSVLEYSQIGRVTEKKQKVNLNKLLEEVIVSIAPPENITISVGNRLPTLVCGKIRIMQVFGNLVENAVKFMDKPWGRIKVDCVEEGGFWKFSVADNGRGIREKYFEKIFQMFQTLVSRDEIEGTGIGLAVVKKLVEMSGGSVWVESQAGEGTTFFFTLPRQVRRPLSLGHKRQSIF